MCPLVAQGQTALPGLLVLPVKNNFTCQAGASLKCHPEDIFGLQCGSLTAASEELSVGLWVCGAYSSCVCVFL